MNINIVKAQVAARRAGKICWAIARFFLLFGLAYTLLAPFLSIISGAFRSTEDMWNPTVVWITRNYTLEHFSAVIEIMDYWRTLLRTAILAGGSAVFQTFTCALTGYGFARYKFRGKNLLFVIVILTIMVPPQVIMIPLYNVYRKLEIFDTVISFWITSIFSMGLRSGLFVYLYRQVFRALPSDLEDAASIDGCGHIGTYFKIMLPNAINSMITVFLFSFIWHSTDYFTTTLIMPTKPTLMVSLSMLSSRIAVAEGTGEGIIAPLISEARLQAGSLIIVIPLVLIFVLCQRYFRTGIERTGLVG